MPPFKTPNDIPHAHQPAPEGTVALMLHGGAWDIPDACCEAHLDGLEQAVALGRRLLEAGHPAHHVVTHVVATMESHGAFDAGRGAVLTRAGTVELDAGIMDGGTLHYASVACLRRQPNPILIAARLLARSTGEVRMLVGEGADTFAKEQGFEAVTNASLICERERARHQRLAEAARSFHTSHAFLPDSSPLGTVGCIARDAKGHVAAATSTGGTPFRPPGRVGDSPLPGCGFYANHHGAASATGWGEAIAASVLCARSVDRLAGEDGPATIAAQKLLTMHHQVRNQSGDGATGGLILMHADGTAGWAFTTPRMARAGWAEGQDVWTAV